MHKNIEIVHINKLAYDVSIHVYIVECLNQVKPIHLLKQLTFLYGENIPNYFL